MAVPAMTGGARPAGVLSRYECPVAVPYRLDLTVNALRRLSTNVVDVLTPDGQYVRALPGSREPVVARVTQVHQTARALEGGFSGGSSFAGELELAIGNRA